MVLVIDTSSARFGLAVIDPGGRVAAETVSESTRDADLARLVRELIEPGRLSAVACATGPGSFTGLRVGAAFAVGLALGRRLPLYGLPTLPLAAARAQEDATGLAEAGRGRVYYQAPDGAARLGEPVDVPRHRPATGWLRPATTQALVGAGVRLLPEAELRGFGEAAASRLGDARKLDYNGLELEYVQSFGPLR